MVTIEMLRAMDALLARETLLPDLAVVAFAIGVWIELSPGPRRSWGFREGAGNEGASSAWSRGVVLMLLLLTLGMFGESSFASNPV